MGLGVATVYTQALVDMNKHFCKQKKNFPKQLNLNNLKRRKGFKDLVRGL